MRICASLSFALMCRAFACSLSGSSGCASRIRSAASAVAQLAGVMDAEKMKGLDECFT